MTSPGRRARHVKHLVALIVSGTLLLTACGDSGSESSGETKFVAVLAAEISKPDSSGDPPPFRVETATCAANTVVIDLGADRLAALGITRTGMGPIEDVDFTDEELTGLIDALHACSDIVKSFADSLISAGDLTRPQGDCFVEQFDPEVLKGLFFAQFRDDQSAKVIIPFFTESGRVAGICGFG